MQRPVPERSPRTRLTAAVIVAIQAVLGGVLAIAGGLYAAAANSTANRQTDMFADLGVAMGIAAAVFGFVVLLVLGFVARQLWRGSPAARVVALILEALLLFGATRDIEPLTFMVGAPAVAVIALLLVAGEPVPVRE